MVMAMYICQKDEVKALFNANSSLFMEGDVSTWLVNWSSRVGHYRQQHNAGS